jgi:RNA polymerase sigma factor (sigma-70 family)
MDKDDSESSFASNASFARYADLMHRVKCALRKYSYNMEYEANDFLHDILLKRLEGNGQHQTIDQSVIDCFRVSSGRKGSHKKRARHIRHSVQSVPSYDVTLCYDVTQLLQNLIPRDREILLLYYIEGLYLKDLSKVYSLSESRIHQIIKKALRKLRK